MMYTERTVAEETERRAKAANLPVTEYLTEMVRLQLETWTPVRVQYEDLKNPSIFADVILYPEVGLTLVRFNVGHAWVSNVMMSRRVTYETRQKLEVVMMILLGVGEEMDPEKRKWYVQHWSQVGRYLGLASQVMFEYDRRTGQNLLGESVDDELEDEEVL